MPPEKQPDYPSPQCPIHTSMLAEIRDSQQRMERLLTGGEKPAEGLLIRVDRLEQSEKTRTWLTHTALGGVLSAMGMAIWGLVRGFRG